MHMAGGGDAQGGGEGGCTCILCIPPGNAPSVRLLALEGRSAKLAGGLSSGAILSGLSRTGGHTKNTDIILWAFYKNAHLVT
jgi:hypothetical protein